MPADEPLTLPAAPAPPTRAPFPLVATLVPLVGGVVLWAVLGSPFALLFALLGPLVVIGGLLDQARGGRKRRRAAEAAYARELRSIEQELAIRQEHELVSLRARHPDVAAFAERSEEIWRSVTQRHGQLVVGRGPQPSAVRINGNGAGPEVEALKRRARTLVDAPVRVDWRYGIAVRAEPALADAVMRAIILQLCLAHTPRDVRMPRHPPPGWEWLAELPHHPAHGYADPQAADVLLGLPGSGPAAPGVLLTYGPPGSAIDPRCGAVLDVDEPDDATLTVGSDRTRVTVEAVSHGQAREIARLLAARGEVLYADQEPSGAGSLGELFAAPGVGATGALTVAVGRERDEPVLVDLVGDGPHAVITGVTGTGKSELLTTWITALCAAYSPRDLVFLLADFKGGMTFDALADLPHVTGVITDLDGGAAERAIASLRAEMRRREHELARSGARDVADPRAELPRLVIVVDEYAALLAEHEGLHRIFADVAARGRALGMHLILGSQRVSGSMTDSLLANCPLRIALRAADAADSRAVLGDDAAARLPGGAAGKGRAFVRRAGDSAPRPFRVALTTADELAGVVESSRGSATAVFVSAPWLPALPTQIGVHELRRHDVHSGDVVLALADDPARQRQFPVVLGDQHGMALIGRAGSGKSEVIRLIAQQALGAVDVPHDLEVAWDLLMGEDAAQLWLVDDADDLLARLPPDHSAAAADRLDRVAREGRLVLTARSLSGRLARIADALPRRALLALSSRSDHVAAGGEGAGFRRDLPPGRALLDGWEVQFARASGERPPAQEARLAEWEPGARSGEGHGPDEWTDALAGVVTRRVEDIASELRARGDDRSGVRRIRDLPLGARLADLQSTQSQILIGDGEDWLARWGLLQEVRAKHPLVIDADCPAELRTVGGERGLPPYARPGAGRAWLCPPNGRPIRVGLVGAMPGAQISR